MCRDHFFRVIQRNYQNAYILSWIKCFGNSILHRELVSLIKLNQYILTFSVKNIRSSLNEHSLDFKEMRNELEELKKKEADYDINAVNSREQSVMNVEKSKQMD